MTGSWDDTDRSGWVRNKPSKLRLGHDHQGMYWLPAEPAHAVVAIACILAVITVAVVMLALIGN